MIAKPTASIVIPAHNEAAVIGRLVDAILEDAELGEFHIVVACNGCVDDTPAEAHRRNVIVVEIEEATKVGALNEGDKAAAGVFPRLYLDADIVISTADLRNVVRALSVEAPVVAAPAIAITTEGRPRLVRGYYRTWVQLPWVTQGIIGSGFYGLSKLGRARFGDFPDLIGDDLFVRQLFLPSERLSVADATFRIEAPHNTMSLIRGKARVAAGVSEFLAKRPIDRPPVSPQEPAARRGGSLPFLRLAEEPANWGPMLAYGFVRGAARVYGAYLRRSSRPLNWGQDQTTRLAE